MRIVRWLLLLSAIAALAAGGLVWWAEGELSRPFAGYGEPRKVVEVTPGSSAGAILTQLEEEGVLADARLSRLYLVHVRKNPSLKAGEYAFDSPLAATEVIDKLVSGEVLTHPVTVIEGLDIDETAQSLADAGFGDREVLLAEMRSPERIADLDPAAESLEGYLFPDTYAFAKGTSEAEIVDAMVGSFRDRLAGELADADIDPASADLRALVTLASIVEKEAALDEERPTIAGVYANRLRRGIALYADPTVIFALKLAGTWDGNLRKPDLQIDSPYNTYRYPGLPPGPICSPGLASLLAALRPADVPYLYFVSRNDGSHVFAATLAEHNRNVNEWQKRYWRERWARERGE